MTVERIIPSELDDDELWRRNDEYVSADAYDAAIARIAELEAALRKINSLIDNPARFNPEVQAVLDAVIDTSDVKFK